jgi:hypothetical protein
VVWWLAVLGCKPEPADPVVDDGVGIVGDGLANPFPSMLLMDQGRVAIPAESLPAGGETPIPVDRVAWRSGFSQGQTSVLRLGGLDPSSLPDWRSPTPGAGGVVLADLTDNVWLPVFAELDAWPDAVDPALLIRPLQAVPSGHHVAVAVTTAVVARPARFEALLEGDPPASIAGIAAGTRAVVNQLEALGLARADIALAWDYPVDAGTTPLATAIAAHALPGTWTLDRIRNADDGDIVAGPLTWRAAEGTFTVTDFLVDDQLLDLVDGTAQPTGTAEAALYVHIPTSVKDAPAGTVPILVFGHGIFAEPDNYLDEADDPSGVLALADAGGFLVVAGTWRGLTTADLVGTIAAASDFGKLPVVSDRLVQGQVNVRTLMELVADGALLEDPALLGASGQVLGDPSRIYYYGISLGAIQGMVMLAQDPPIESAVTHVGGGVWSTMLERSSNWPIFESPLTSAVPDPGDRQALYAFSQLFWDAADPIAWTTELASTPFLLQESIGDEQVPNLSTEVVARSVGLPLLQPSVNAPFGVDPVTGPLPPDSRALVQFDPELPIPPDGNRPPEESGAHGAPRLWPGTEHQTLDYLLQDRIVVHHCGDDPCSASNQGE